ncbi:MAG: MarR family transcriptional regulator [Deltaproteobacteria bacterium]|nr:MarR family transcriptional regulator [Deltaproteobacteria bacterium]
MGAVARNVCEEEARILKTYIRFMRAAESVTARIHRKLPEHNLSFSQYGTLEALYHLGSLCQRDIAAKLLKSARNITMVVDNLETRGLVRRERDSQDRRFMHVHLTVQGRALFEEVFPSIKASILAEMGTLSDEEREQFASYCLRLGKK